MLDAVKIRAHDVGYRRKIEEGLYRMGAKLECAPDKEDGRNKKKKEQRKEMKRKEEPRYEAVKNPFSQRLAGNHFENINAFHTE